MPVFFAFSVAAMSTISKTYEDSIDMLTRKDVIFTRQKKP